MINMKKGGFGSKLWNLPVDNTVDTYWEQITSTDQDYDVEYLIRIITYKLLRMSNCFEAKADELEDLNYIKLRNEMRLCFLLGRRILTHNYFDKYDVVYTPEELNIFKTNPEYSDFDDYLTEITKSIAERERDIKIFFKNLSHMADGWFIG